MINVKQTAYQFKPCYPFADIIAISPLPMCKLSHSVPLVYLTLTLSMITIKENPKI